MDKKNLVTLIIERLEKQDDVNSGIVEVLKITHEVDNLLSKRIDLLTERVDSLEEMLRVLVKTLLKGIRED